MTTEQTLLPCQLRVGRTTFGKGVSISTVQECIDRLWDAYKDLATVPAPVIDGAQDEINKLHFGECTNCKRNPRAKCQLYCLDCLQTHLSTGPAPVPGVQEAMDVFNSIISSAMSHINKYGELHYYEGEFSGADVETIKAALIAAGAKDSTGIGNPVMYTDGEMSREVD